MMLSPISPGFTPSKDITHTVTPVQGAQRERIYSISIMKLAFCFCLAYAKQVSFNTVYFTWGKVLNLLHKLLTVGLGESSRVSSGEGEDVLQLRQHLFGRVLGLARTGII